jgi:hypothetical protein
MRQLHVLELIETELQKEGFTLLEEDGSYGVPMKVVAAAIRLHKKEFKRGPAQ